MYFFIGWIIGLLNSIIVIILCLYNKRQIDSFTTRSKNWVEQSNPQNKGMVIDPISEPDEIRQTIIDRNKEDGKDTPISELL